MEAVRSRTTSEQFVYKCDTRVATLHNRAIQKLVQTPLFCFTPSSMPRIIEGMNESLLPLTTSVTDKRVFAQWKIVASQKKKKETVSFFPHLS